MTTAKTPEERERNARYQREYRARKAKQQATEVRGIFAHPNDHAEVKEAAAKIARRRERAAKRAQPGTRAGVIEAALMRAHKIKQPKEQK